MIRLFLKNKSKITIIIICQIGLMVGSFLTIAILESQTSLLGNSVNIAGKNRLLASQLNDEAKDWGFVKNPEANMDKKLQILKENIHLLKNGGITNGNVIKELDRKFTADWVEVDTKFTEIETIILEYQGKSNNNLSYVDLAPVETSLTEFIFISDNIVQKLSNDIEEQTNLTVYLQILLLILNITVHIILILIIIGIFKSEFKKNMKLEKLATIGELSSSLAHDMRTPLSNINMSLQLIKSKTKNKTESQKIEIIEKSVKRLSHQIEEVMDFVRSREPNLNSWKLNSILQNSLENLEVPDSIRIIFPEKNILIKCDKEHFEILFINLLSNALDSIGSKGSIKIDAKESLNEIIIKVEDSGPGIPENDIETIFDPLVTFKEKGTGLGLASCKNIIETHGGKITVQNNPTTFSIILPKFGN